jgi:PAS domain S-box-containing protein
MMDTRENINNQYVISELAGICQQLSDLEKSLVNNPLDTKATTSPLNEDSTAAFIMQDGTIKNVNKPMCEMSGYPEHELIGISPLTFVIPEDRTPLEKYMASVNDKESPSVFEFRILTKSSNTKWVLAKVSSVRNNGSQITAANLIDITDHKKTEQSNIAVWERYQDLCENMDDMILCMTPAGQIIYANRAICNLFGYSSVTINKLSVFEILPQDYREHYRGLIQRATSGESISNIAMDLLNKDGKRIPVEGSINCRFIDEKPDYLRIIIHDVTKRKEEQAEAESMLLEARELNTKLKQSNRELEDFAHIASHDLQEPLRKISSFGGLVKDSLKDKLSTDEKENLDFMIDGAKRMQLMINDLLTYSRITTKAKSFQSVDPNTVINDLRNIELANIIEETTGTLVIPRPLLIISGDPSQIYQLFQNLNLNAFKFHKPDVKPIIKITCTPVQNGRIQFYIQDNGIGIEPEYHEQIFTMFKRLHSRESFKGTGIGLAVCKKIVQRHGGEIGLKSKHGEGTTFWFTLPSIASK